MASFSSEFFGSSDSSFEKAGEKPRFLQTCSLLSRYLKDNKGVLGDLSLAMSTFNENGMHMDATPFTPTSNIDTMKLFPMTTREFMGVNRDLTSMDLFPQHSGFGPNVCKDEVSHQVDHSVKQPVQGSSPMTIFYGGKVFVFNDISADKAKEITLFASKASYQDPGMFVSAPNQKPREMPNTMEFNFADLPLSRKASLTRFLEKRKDRILARAPYQKSFSKTSSPPEENKKSWLGLSPFHQYENQS